MSLGIERGHYIAMCVQDPEAAAQFAAEKMGLQLAHVTNDGSYYLQAKGWDPYSLVYKPGEPGIDHISYLVKDRSTLLVAEEKLRKAGVEIVQTVSESGEWKHDDALRFLVPGGFVIELTTGIHVEKPMAALVEAPGDNFGPISLDHAVTRIIDTEEAYRFWTGIMGLKLSARIATPDDQTAMMFFRCKTLFHCYALAKSDRNALHHYQLTLKDPVSLYATYERMRELGVDIVWGPLRHGPGHNIAFYIRDYAGNVVEYSCEEEIILHDETYRPRNWSVTDPKTLDEWGTMPPEGFL